LSLVLYSRGGGGTGGVWNVAASTHPILSCPCRSAQLVYAIKDGMPASLNSLRSFASFVLSIDLEAKLNPRFICRDRSLVLGPCTPLA
jgi:hypothetical protein